MYRLCVLTILLCSFFQESATWSQSFSAHYLDTITKASDTPATNTQSVPQNIRQLKTSKTGTDQLSTVTADSLPLIRPFHLDLPALKRYLLQFSEEETVSLNLTIGNRQLSLEVKRSNLLHPDYQRQTSQSTKNTTISAKQALFLTGRLAGQRDRTVALMINDHFLFGQIGDLMIEPAAPYFDHPLVEGALVSYLATNEDHLPQVFCGSKETAKAQMEDLVDGQLQQAKDRQAADCYTLELAIAADFLAFQQFGEVHTLENYYLGILNMVRLAFDDEFTTEFRFAVRGFHIVDCEGCDPWTASTEASDLLASFRDWGNAGGFGFPYDLATMWSGRVLNDSLAGLGYLSVVCETRRYHVLRNYTDKIGLLRTLQAHEIGHNFSARHDPEEAPYIMAPAIADFAVWSETSQSKINSYIAQLVVQKEWCLGACLPPEADFEPPFVEGCAPVLAQFADNSRGEVTAWQWSFDGGTSNSDTLPNPVVWYQHPGVYAAQLRVGNASGESTFVEDTAVIIRGLPQPSFELDIDTLLRTVRFRFTGTDAQLFLWQFGDGTETQEENPIHTFPENSTYEVHLIVANDCGADTSSMLLSLASPLQAGFLSEPPIGCAPLSVQFADNSTGDITSRTWTFPGGFPVTSTEVDPLVRYDQPGVYSARLQISKDELKSDFTDEHAVTVQGPPEISFTANIDPPQRFVQFNYTGSDAQTYSWQFGDGTGSESKNPSHTYPVGGAYEVQLTASNSCGANIFRQTITIPTRPQAAFSADIVQGCSPFTTTFSDNSAGEMTTRKWTFPGGTPGTSTGRTPKILYTQPGRYSVRLEVTNPAGTDTLTQEAYIDVLHKPEARFEIAGRLGDTTFVFLNDSFEALAYEWDFGDGQRSEELLPSHYYQNDGEYRVQLIAINECGRDTVTESLTVLRAPRAMINISQPEGCVPVDIQFTDQSFGTIEEREWHFPGGSPDQSSESQVQVQYQEAGTYDVQLIVSNAAGIDTTLLSEAVRIGEPILADFSVAIQPGDTLASFRNHSQNAEIFYWQFGDGMESTEANPIHYYREDGRYEVQLISESACGRDTTFKTIQILRPPVPAFEIVSQTGCSSKVIQFEDRTSSTVSERTWTFEGGVPASSNLKNPIVTYTQPGYYPVKLLVRNDAGEGILEKSDLVYIPESPIARFSYQYIVGDSTVAFQNRSERSASYLWDFGDGQQSTEANPMHTYLQNGDYTIKLEAQNECKTSLMVVQIKIVTLPRPDFRATATVGCAPFPIQYENTSSDNTQRLFWQFPGGQPNTSHRLNPLVTYSQPGLYDVRLSVSNPAGEVVLKKERWVRIEGPPQAAFAYEQDGAKVQFHNRSNEESDYIWNFGDGQTSREYAPAHEFAKPGEYEVQLVEINSCGADTTKQILSVIINDTAKPAWYGTTKVFPNPNTGDFILQLKTLPATQARLRLWNSYGQLIQATYWNNVLSNTQRIQIPESLPGLYLLELDMDEKKGYWKVIVLGKK